MDRAAPRARGRRRRGVSQAAPSSSRARRRDKAPVVVVDLGDDEDEDCGGGGGARKTVGGAAGGRGGSTEASPPPPPPMMVPAGAVAMRTRSRRRAMQAAAVVEETPTTKRRKRGATTPDAAEASRGRGSKAAAASRATSRDKRRAGASRSTSRDKRRARSGRASEPARAARACKRKGIELGAETEVDAPARSERAKAPCVSESDDDGGRGDDASDDGNAEPRAGVAIGADLVNGDRRTAKGEDHIEEHGGDQENSAVNLNDDLVSGDAEAVEGAGDEDTRGNSGLASTADVVAEEMAPFEDDYDDEMLEEQLVGDVIRAYSNGRNFDADEADWEAEDEMEFDDDADNSDFMDDAHDSDFVNDADEGGKSGDDAENSDFMDDAHDSDFVNDADEGGKSEPIKSHAKMEIQDLVNQKVVLCGGGCEEEGGEKEELGVGKEAGKKEDVEPKSEAAPGSDKGGSHLETMSSDEEIKVLENMSSAPSRKASVQSKLPTIPSCVAWRTRSSWGINRDRLSYNTYFEALSDEPKEDDDDTEVELDEDEDGNNDDGSSDAYDKDDEEKEEEEEEEEAERRKLNNGIYTSDDDMINITVPTSRYDMFERKNISRYDMFKRKNTSRYDIFKRKNTSRYDIFKRKKTSRYDIEWVEDEDKDANVDTLQPISLRKGSSWNPVAVGNDTFTEQQKQSRFTWQLERRKKNKLEMKTNPLYERDLNSDSNSSGSDQIRKYGFKRDGSHKVDMKKKHTSSKSGKKSSSAIMLKRQSLLKLLVDKMSGDKSLESFSFDQNPQLQFIFKEMHPLVFSFGDEDLEAADRPEQDVGLDMLWADFDFALESENIGTYYDDEVHLNICRCVVLVFIFFLSIKTHADFKCVAYLNTDSTTRTMIITMSNWRCTIMLFSAKSLSLATNTKSLI